jgi:predicted  nucleic acid-binding Zn-ribbon protein
MSTPEDREALRQAAEHVEETRRRLEAGEAELRRQREAVADTERHLTGMSRWIEQTEQQLGEQRARREELDDDALPPAA